ncbi:hypothetical protein [Gordonia terrae]|uniref:Uncharacterized protein n=2 Tax=Gordonia terrae TaxID=2055 RepID=A0AAD0K8V0_9ACTN|nr:hypothetical protein [Gordonia terrae]VTR09017.1 Uncharacterised protein [Clostridioides difficile]ANY21725.1 hypothetical protein BCM27_01865 [Gordonia terrae]AWO82457.1 hypothetical protein DLJ61_01875 [Gordonia terrae]VTS19809.1 Uncharacterised protein [Gordonia terrae]GAB44944.1 hypothetical protein GOTRE_076_00370 [Gordonia terrae NBRC 100016]
MTIDLAVRALCVTVDEDLTSLAIASHDKRSVERTAGLFGYDPGEELEVVAVVIGQRGIDGTYANMVQPM